MNWRGVARSRWRLLRNTVFGARRSGKSRTSRSLIATILGLVLGGIIYFAISLAFGELSASGSGPRENGALLGVIFGAALFAMLLFDMHEAVSALIADSDLQFLRAAPIRPAALFAIKLLDVLPRTSAVLVTLAVPAIAAYARVHPLAWWTWLALIPALFALWLIPLAFGAAGALFLLRIVPARVAREVMRLLATFVMLGLWLANSFVLPRLVNNPGDVAAWLTNASITPPLTYRLSPGSWAAAIATAGATRDPGALVPPALALLFAVALVLTLAAASASLNLGVVQARLAATGGRRNRSATRARASARPRGFLGAMLLRDARILRRDWSVLADVVVTSLLWMLLPLASSLTLNIGRSLLLRTMLLALVAGLGYEVGARALPLERRGIAWARLAPVSPFQWVLARWLGAMAISVPIAAVASLVAGRVLGLPPRESVSGLGEALPALALAISIGIWTGARYGNPDWTHPRAMLSPGGRFVAIGLMLLQGIGWIGWAMQQSAAAIAAPLLVLPISLLALHAAGQAIGRRAVT